MSIKNLYNPDNVDNESVRLYAKDITVDSLDVQEIHGLDNGAIQADDLTVNGDLIAGGNNYSTATLGNPGDHLSTDGAGTTFWTAVTGGIEFNGTPPTIAGQLTKYSGTDGSSVDQSLIVDDGVNLNLNNQNITNVNLVDGVDIDAFKTDYDNKVNQDVKALSNPIFTNMQAQEHLIFDPVDNANRYDFRSNSGQMQLYNHTGNVQLRVNNNSSLDVVNNLNVGGNTLLSGTTTHNSGSLSYTTPPNRGVAGNVMTMFNSTGTAVWGEGHSYVLSFGGVLNSLPKLAIVNGDPDNATTNNVDAKSETRIPYTSNLRRVSLTSDSGTNGSSCQILKNDVVVHSFVLIAPSFVYNLIGVPFNDGSRLSVRLTGANIGNANIQLFFT